MKKGKREREKGRNREGEGGRGRKGRAILRLQINRECDYNPMAEGADTRNLKVFMFLKWQPWNHQTFIDQPSPLDETAEKKCTALTEGYHGIVLN